MSETSVRAISTKIANRSRYNPPNDPELVELRRDLAVARLTEQTRKVIEGWPPPTAEQLSELRSLLKAGAR